MKEIQCPYCQSVYQLDGQLCFSAPVMQTVPCPVCSYPQSIATDFPIPVLWVNPKIILRKEPLMPYAEWIGKKPALAKSLTPTAQEKQALYGFTTPEFWNKLNLNIKSIGIVIAVIAVLYLLKRG
jgi:hypothetical protein